MTLFKRPFFTPTSLLPLTIALLLGIVLTQVSPFVVLAAVGGTAVCLLILRYPIAGVGFALLAGPFGALESLFLGNQLFDSGQIFLLLTVGAWLVSRLGRRDLRLPKTAVMLPLFLFMGVAYLSMLDAISITFALRELLKWIEIWLLVVIVVSEGERFSGTPMQYVQLIVGLFLFSGLIQGLIGVWQFGLRGVGPEHFAIPGGFYRAYGSFEQPNPFGGMMHQVALLAVGTFTAAFWPLWHQGKRFYQQLVEQRRLIWPEQFGWWLFVAVCGGTAVLALIFSWSRGAWLGFAAGGAMIGLFWPRQRLLGLAALLAGLLLVAGGLQFDLLPASVSDRLLGFVSDFQLGDVRGVDINDANYSVLERLAHWQAAIGMAEDQFWLGVGFGNYEPAYAAYALINWPDALGHAHNYYLNIFAETGVLGLTTYLFFWGWVVWHTVRTMEGSQPLARGVLLGLLGCWAALSVHHLVDKLYVNNLYIQFGVLLGLLQFLRRENRVDKKELGLITED